jgi:hypothetical protein
MKKEINKISSLLEKVVGGQSNMFSVSVETDNKELCSSNCTRNCDANSVGQTTGEYKGYTYPVPIVRPTE